MMGCDSALPSSFYAEPDEPARQAPIPTTSEDTCESCGRILDCCRNCPKGCGRMTTIPPEAYRAAYTAAPTAAGSEVSAALTAALPHIEAAIREQVGDELRAAGTDHYPHDVFPPLNNHDWVQIRAALATVGITLDRLSAELIRRGMRIAANEVEGADR